MPFKRPDSPQPDVLGSSSRSGTPSARPRPAKRPRLSSRGRKRVLKGIKIHILQAKLQPDILSELYALAESSGATLVAEAKDAEVVITAIGMRKRLERHIPWEIAVSLL